MLRHVKAVNPHAQHDTVTEHDEQSHMRSIISSQPNLQRVYEAAFKQYAARPCFGQLRDGAVTYGTYAEEYDRIVQIARSLAAVAKPHDRIAISFAGSRLWFAFILVYQLRSFDGCFSGTILKWLLYSDEVCRAAFPMAGQLLTGCLWQPARTSLSCLSVSRSFSL